MNINDYKKEWDELDVKCNLSGEEALEEGYALRDAKEQTPEICLEAVKQNGYSLRYVNENIFSEDEDIIMLNEVQYRKV